MIIIVASMLAVLTVPFSGVSLAPLAKLPIHRPWLVWLSIGVQFAIDGWNLGWEVPALPYTLPWDTRTATNGSHIVSATARDEMNGAHSDQW